MPGQMWEVVGGGEAGGIIVRDGKSLKSAQVDPRLATASLIREVALEDGRLQYVRVTGSGPDKGWVSLKLKEKELLVKTSQTGEEGKEGKAPAAALAPALASPPTSAKAAGTKPIGLMFPGQGSQYVKMMEGVKDLPAVREMLGKAESILGWDVLKMCLEGPEESLEETRHCQPAMFVAGLAGLEQLRADNAEAVTRCQATAGLSLGEYTALCAAGVFSFEDGLRLVKLRGEAMQEAAALSSQRMLSVAGLDKEQLDQHCRDAAKKEGPGATCQVANCLFPKGFACAGSEAAILNLQETTSPIALQTKLLKTSGAFHTPLMQPAADKFASALDDLLPNMSPPICAVYANATGEAIKPGTPPAEIVELLKRQLTSPVLWEQCCRAMIKDGVTEFHEVGPMKQLKAMMKRISPTIWKTTFNVDV